MPTWQILILHVKHGHVSQYSTEPSRMRSLPASKSAFSSAWMHRQVDSPTPEPFASLHRGQPPSAQFRRPRGVPLYPVLITRRSRPTRTQPTRRFMQLDLCAARDASAMKYVSQPGRIRSGLGISSFPSVAYRWASDDEVLSNLTVAREMSGCRPVAASYRCRSFAETNSSRLMDWLERCWNRRQRKVSGASIEMSRKNGRRMKTSSTCSVGMSVVTKRLRHRRVTKSNSSSAVVKTWEEDVSLLLDTTPFEAKVAVTPSRDGGFSSETDAGACR